MTDHFKIAIIGSGPGGVSAATHAAGLKLSHVLLESEPAPVNTVRKYQRGKHVMAEPGFIPLRSAISFAAGAREKILRTWEEELAAAGVNLRLNARVAGISGEQGHFEIEIADGTRLTAEFVILAIGVQGNIRKLGVTGENLQMVQYQLDDPGAFVDETIVIVGAGDSAIENALALTERNRVILLNRQIEITRCNEENHRLLNEAADDFLIEVWSGSRIIHAEAIKESGFSLRLTIETPGGQETLACHRVIARLGADPPRALVESFGVRFPGPERSAVPQLTARFESNVKGLYIIGALGGFPLIKQAVNQGYEVVEHILGNVIDPADEATLKEKLTGLIPGDTLEQKLAYIRQQLPLLEPLTALQLREFMLESTVLRPAPDELIFNHADFNTSFFSVLQGDVHLQSQKRNFVIEIGAGDFFGETGLLSGRGSSKAARAGRDCLLIETPRRAMHNLSQRVGTARAMLQSRAMARLVQSYFEMALPEQDLAYLVQHAQSREIEAGDFLYGEGAVADELFLISKGAVTVSRGDMVLAFITAGNPVGDDELISAMPRTSRAQAAMLTEAVVIGYQYIKQVSARNEALRKYLNDRHLHYLRRENSGVSFVRSTGGTATGLEQSDEMVNFLLNQGVGEATDILLIDYARCIRCDSCEQACTDAHNGYSRMSREAGPTYGNIHLPRACRHCEHPQCMKDCPPNAIRRSVNGEIFINDSCIGCGNCVKNCPYDAMELVVPAPEKAPPGLMQLLMDMLLDRAPEASAAGQGSSKKAVKCDMCNNLREGPACVRACPTGAAIRVKPEQFLN